MTINKMRDLHPNDSGRLFRAMIESILVEGKVYYQKSDNRFYLCQNIKNGDAANNKLGYRFSWTVGTGKVYDIESHNVREFVFLSDAIDTGSFKDFKVGDEVIKDGVVYSIIQSYKDKLFLLDPSTNIVEIKTSLFDEGFRLHFPEVNKEEEDIDLSDEDFFEVESESGDEE